jgi:hypothetical protein
MPAASMSADEMLANGALIAESPKMLELIQGLVDASRSTIGDYRIHKEATAFIQDLEDRLCR